MLRVFVCSPFRAVRNHTVEDNVLLAKELCRSVVKAGHAPFAPHLHYPAFLREETDRDKGIAAGVAWLGQADEMWIYAEELEDCTEGMRTEVERAEKFSLPPRIVFMPDEFQGVKWAATAKAKEDAKLFVANCVACVGTGKVLEDHDGRAGYSQCRLCEGTGKAA